MTPVRKVVFPAAGLGTRFLPASKAVPKELLPLIDRPLIQYGLEEAVASGLTQAVLVTSRGKSAIEDHFDRCLELEQALEAKGRRAECEALRRLTSLASVTSVRQGEALGLGHAVLTARPAVGDEPFAVLLSDDVIRADVPCLKQLLDVHAETGASVICIEPVPPEKTASYGIVAGERVGPRLYKLTDLVEKPSPDRAPSNLGIIGRYVLTPGVFGELERGRRGAGGEIQLTDAIRALLAREPVYAYAFEGVRHDAGNPLGLLKATVDFALLHPELGGPLRDYLKSLGV